MLPPLGTSRRLYCSVHRQRVSPDARPRKHADCGKNRSAAGILSTTMVCARVPAVAVAPLVRSEARSLSRVDHVSEYSKETLAEAQRLINASEFGFRSLV